MGRSLLAVVAGFLAVAVLSSAVDAVLHATGVFPPFPKVMSGGLFVLALAYRAVFSVLGGAVTARLTRRDDGRDVWALAGLGLLSGLAGVAIWATRPEIGPLWYVALIPLTGVPAVLIGGRLARR